MSKKKVFGISPDLEQGLNQVVTAAKNNAGSLRYETVPLTKIKLDPNNPRKLAISPADLPDGPLSSDVQYELKKSEFDGLSSLAHSIKQKGVRHAIEVYKDGTDYQIISGERRYLASIIAGMDNIQAKVLDAKPSEFDLRFLQWIENIERVDLNPWERVENVKMLAKAYSKDEGKPLSATVLSNLLACSLPYAMMYMAMLELNQDDEIYTALRNNQISSLEKAALVAKIIEPSLRNQALKACISGATLKELRDISQKDKSLHIKAIINSENSLPQTRDVGRQASRVAMGYTSHTVVVKRLILAILKEPEYMAYKEQLLPTDWSNFKNTTRCFQRLIKLMEKKEASVSVNA